MKQLPRAPQQWGSGADPSCPFGSGGAADRGVLLRGVRWGHRLLWRSRRGDAERPSASPHPVAGGDSPVPPGGHTASRTPEPTDTPGESREGVNLPRPLQSLLGRDGRKFRFGPGCHRFAPCGTPSSRRRGRQQRSLRPLCPERGFSNCHFSVRREDE